jgi:hypothetical protein
MRGNDAFPSRDACTLVILRHQVTVLVEDFDHSVARALGAVGIRIMFKVLGSSGSLHFAQFIIILLITMTPDDFRQIALTFHGAVESSHMNHPDFRVNGKIFATLSEDNLRGMVKLTPQQQHGYLQTAPDVFVPASGAWGKQGATMVELRHAHTDIVSEALETAYRNLALAKPAKPRRRTKGTR